MWSSTRLLNNGFSVSQPQEGLQPVECRSATGEESSSCGLGMGLVVEYVLCLQKVPNSIPGISRYCWKRFLSEILEGCHQVHAWRVDNLPQMDQCDIGQLHMLDGDGRHPTLFDQVEQGDPTPATHSHATLNTQQDWKVFANLLKIRTLCSQMSILARELHKEGART